MATYPSAVRWDAATKDYELDATTGEHVEIHPVDAAVTLRLCFRRGSLAGVPTVGHTYLEVDLGASHESRQQDIERRTEDSLGDLITNGYVAVKHVAHDVMPHGGLRVLVEYTNLRTGEAGKVTV